MRDRDPFAYEVIKKDIELAKAGKASYITKGSLIRRITYSFSNRTPQSGGITKEQKNELMSLLSGVKDSCEMKTIDKLNNAIKALDSDFYQLKFYPSEKVEGTKQFSKEELDEYAKALLKKYGDKRVVITQMGKVYKTFYA